MRQALFGEDDPGKQWRLGKAGRVEKEVWEACSKAEVEARNAKAESDMRQETSGCSDN